MSSKIALIRTDVTFRFDKQKKKEPDNLVLLTIELVDTNQELIKVERKLAYLPLQLVLPVEVHNP